MRRGYLRIDYNTTMEALKDLDKVEYVYEEGTPYKYCVFITYVYKSDGISSVKSGFPMDSKNKFYTLLPIDK